jgi:hypothetical protein
MRAEKVGFRSAKVRNENTLSRSERRPCAFGLEAANSELLQKLRAVRQMRVPNAQRVISRRAWNCLAPFPFNASRKWAECHQEFATRLQISRRSQSMGVHPRLGRGDAASGLLCSGGRLQARREMTRTQIGNAHLPHGPQFLRKFRTWNLLPASFKQ